MLLSHAVALAEARSFLAALADGAQGFDAALEYERVLIQLDWLHGGAVPSITVVPPCGRDALHLGARAAIVGLEQHAVDPLELAICSSMLEAAWELDQAS